MFPSNLEFCNKELMSWATVRSRSCFCQLYRASPSLAAKDITNLISVLTIWWCPCVEFSLVLLEEGVCNDQCVLLPLPCFHFHFQGQTYLLLRVSLDFLLLHFSPLRWKGHLLGGVSSRRSCRSSYLYFRYLSGKNYIE